MEEHPILFVFSGIDQQWQSKRKSSRRAPRPVRRRMRAGTGIFGLFREGVIGSLAGKVAFVGDEAGKVTGNPVRITV